MEMQNLQLMKISPVTIYPAYIYSYCHCYVADVVKTHGIQMYIHRIITDKGYIAYSSCVWNRLLEMMLHELQKAMIILDHIIFLVFLMNNCNVGNSKKSCVIN